MVVIGEEKRNFVASVATDAAAAAADGKEYKDSHRHISVCVPPLYTFGSSVKVIIHQSGDRFILTHTHTHTKLSYSLA